ERELFPRALLLVLLEAGAFELVQDEVADRLVWDEAVLAEPDGVEAAVAEAFADARGRDREELGGFLDGEGLGGVGWLLELGEQRRQLPLEGRAHRLGDQVLDGGVEAHRLTSSESNNTDVDTPSAAARRCSVSTRGIFSPASKALIALCLTPTRSARSCWDSCWSVRRRLMRSPSVETLSLMLLEEYTRRRRVVNTVGDVPS